MISCRSVWNTYWPLGKFLFPLGLTNIAPDIADQALNRGITSMNSGDQSTIIIDSLASFGLAISLMKFFAFPLGEVRHVSLVLVHSQKDRRICILLSLIMALGSCAIFLVLGLSVMGTMLIEELHEVKHSVSENTKIILVYLSLTPILEILCQIHAGILLQYRQSVVVGASSLADVAMQVVTVLVLVQTNLTTTNPLLIPVLSVYVGYHTRIAIILIGYYCKPGIQHLLPYDQNNHEPLTIKNMLKFFWPLIFINMVHKISRPIINLFVARNQASSGNSEKAVAVLTAVYPIPRTFYGWQNNLKEVQPAFAKPSHGHRAYTSRERVTFTVGCIVFCMLITLPTFFSPGVPEKVIHGLVGVDLEFAKLTVVPLQIFSFMTLPVASRSHLTGWLMIKKKTKYAAPSGVLRLAAIIIACIVFPLMGLNGAEMGVASLLFGFVIEALTVAAGTIFVWKKKNFANEEVTQDAVDLPTEYSPRLSAMYSSQDLHVRLQAFSPHTTGLGSNHSIDSYQQMTLKGVQDKEKDSHKQTT